MSQDLNARLNHAVRCNVDDSNRRLRRVPHVLGQRDP
jgi:hypothetical protein